MFNRFVSDFRVTFTDSLGRSRTCLRTDLSYYKELDCELKVGPPVEETSTKEDTEVNESAKIIPEEVQLWDQKREELRKMWEEEEKRLSEKKDIHYQDVLFDGISFSFSILGNRHDVDIAEIFVRKVTLKNRFHRF